MRKTNSNIQLFLTVLYVAALMISNVIAAKIMQLPFGISMTCAVIVFPITYILSDVFSEAYGYKWSRMTCYLAFAMNVIMVMFFAATVSLKAPVWYADSEAFKTVLSSTPRTLIASLSAFVVGDFVNDKVFEAMKRRAGDGKGFISRAVVSSLFGELCDSMIFIPVAFFGAMNAASILTMIGSQVALKTLYEFIISPVTAVITRTIKKTEETENK